MTAIISITTIPDRINRIEPCIKGLCKQGLPVYLWAVDKIERSDTRLGKLPAYLNKYDIHVQVVPDCGPITKLLPALRLGVDIILTADDDCIYGKGWAKKLLYWTKKLPRAALGYRGRVLKKGGYLNSKVILKSRIQEPVQVDIITGVHGALYKTSFFDLRIFEEWKRWPTNDDLVITAHLKRRRVPRFVVPGTAAVKNSSVRRIKPLIRVNSGKDKNLNDEGLRVLGLQLV